MIKKRIAIGRLYTPSQNFLITKKTPWVGTEDDDPQIDDELSVYYYPRPGLLLVKGSFVYKKFTEPMEIHISIEGEKNETLAK